MQPPCRILLIEDDARQAIAIEKACCPDTAVAAIDVVSNGAEGRAALEDGEYDLVICDLALPADERRFEPDTAEGLQLFALMRDRSQGTPVIILSGNADVQMIQGFLQANRSADLYGTRTTQPLVQFFEKEQLPDCVDAVKAHIARIVQLDQLALSLPPGVTLSLSDQRALRIYGRITGAVSAEVAAVDGGLSASRTFRVTYRDDASETTGTVVVKLGDLTSVLREHSRYGELAAKLPVGLGAHILYAVDAGAGQRGALIYQLADDAQSLFGLLKAGDRVAIGATQRLSQKMSEWVVDAPIGVRTLTEIRRGLIGDFKLRDSGWDHQPERDIELQVHESMAHGDLHGANVLVDAEGAPTLIDYGDVRRANAALDPVMLELSVVFHPDVAGAFGSWPTVDQASNWADVGAYCENAPPLVREFVHTCREWAMSVAAGEAEVLASAYGYAVRQLKYAEATAPLARAIAESALKALQA